jgi:hypothetical protein
MIHVAALTQDEKILLSLACIGLALVIFWLLASDDDYPGPRLAI